MINPFYPWARHHQEHHHRLFQSWNRKFLPNISKLQLDRNEKRKLLSTLWSNQFEFFHVVHLHELILILITRRKQRSYDLWSPVVIILFQDEFLSRMMKSFEWLTFHRLNLKSSVSRLIFVFKINKNNSSINRLVEQLIWCKIITTCADRRDSHAKISGKAFISTTRSPAKIFENIFKSNVRC